MTKFLICIVCLIQCLIIGYNKSSSKKITYHLNIDGTNNSKLFSNQIKEVKKLVKNGGFSIKYCFLLDLKLPSGKKRFFVYDLSKDSIIDAGLAAHGSCNTYFLKNVWFSNVPGCGCSSAGLYKIENKYYGRFGLSYKLIGLQKSNSNAYKRSIVLHSYSDVPDNEIYPDPICNSLGCPMTSVKFLKKLSCIIDGSKKPVLLYIF
jgi:hypothetical protein